MILKKVLYSRLNARQKENFNFQKVSAILADYGFVTLWLSDDWQGADFIALPRQRRSFASTTEKQTGVL
jgi:hypothetical protein